MAESHGPTGSPKTYKKKPPLNTPRLSLFMSLNLFDMRDVDYRYEASRDVAFQPALTGTRHITFSIPASDDYYDLNELRFQVKVRLTDPATGYQGLKANLAIFDGNNIRNTYCVNNFAHTIFRDVNMSMNGVLMSEQSNT